MCKGAPPVQAGRVDAPCLWNSERIMKPPDSHRSPATQQHGLWGGLPLLQPRPHLGDRIRIVRGPGHGLLLVFFLGVPAPMTCSESFPFQAPCCPPNTAQHLSHLVTPPCPAIPALPS